MSVFLPQCTPEQISGDLHDELMYQLEHDDGLQKVGVALLHLFRLEREVTRER